MSALFEPIRLRDVEARNRAWVSPMCEYSCETDGLANDWHMVHLGSRAVGGAGLVMTEATAVTAEGRITPWDLGLWSDAHADVLRPIARFIESQGAAPALQLAHAGRKASTNRPWASGKPIPPSEEPGWEPVGPAPIPFNEGYTTPRALTTGEIREIVDAFAAAARRAAAAGFRAVEVHAAHGYLLHQFLSPLTNMREDEYGGSFEGRARFALETVRAVREEFPREMPVLVRLSTTEYVEGGWDIDHTVELAKLLKTEGVDLIDASSGGNLPQQRLHPYPGYQVANARRIRQEAGIPTAAVGLITEPSHAEAVVAGGDADVVLLGREELRDPYWPLHAAHALGVQVPWPVQYERARP